jgi:O-acetyl-ADP-ribose deacetylase (regulator of RNase III)/DNA-binding XRE family transcriptional regulator
MKVDAIVNTTNEEMIGYSGIDLAVHTLAGEELDEECAKLAPLGLGQAKITRGYNLPCKYVIHTSGPRWRGGLLGESIILKSCYIESLKLAVAHKCSTVAFPLISAGVYQYPKDQVLKFAIQTITEFLLDHELTVYLCVYDKDSYSFSQKLFSDIKAFINDEYVDEHDEDFYDDLEICSAVSCEEAEPILKERKRMSAPVMSSVADKSLEEYLKAMDKSFAYKLFDLIDERGMTDVECYKKANVSKQTWYKIMNEKNYKPSKNTVISFAIALELSLEETKDLLETVGFTLSKSSKFDIIIEYFLKSGEYNIFTINETLFKFDQVCLGV